MPRRSPRLNHTVSDIVTSVVNSVPSAPSAPTVPVPTAHIVHMMPVKPAPILPKAQILIDMHSDLESSVQITIKDNVCRIDETYIDTNNRNVTTTTYIPISGFATYLYTYLHTACLDDHESWKSLQIMTSFIPRLYIKRETLAAKREHIVQTIVSHVMNLI